MQKDVEKLKQLNRRNCEAPYARDRDLVDRLAQEQAESRQQVAEVEATAPPGGVVINEGVGPPIPPPAPPRVPQEETIVARRGRPVLAIREGETVLQFRESDSEVWREKLVAARAQLHRAIPSVGRIELTNLISSPSIGTGWMIDPEIVVTNRHVSEFFAERAADAFRFRLGDDRRKFIGVQVDFLEEIDSLQENEFDISEIVYVAPWNLPDVALLRVSPRRGATLPPPLVLTKDASSLGKTVAVVGYPHKDPDLPQQALMDDIFGSVYERKRIAPGFVSDHLAEDILHDCTTLKGNSGSPIIDLDTGEVIGLHRAGVFLEANYAVAAARLGEALQAARRPAVANIVTGVRPVVAAETATRTISMPSNELKFTIPLTITVSLGDSAQALVAAAVQQVQPRTGLTWEQIEAAIPTVRAALGNRRDVVAVKPGYRVTNGVMTKEPVVVVAVDQRFTPEQLDSMGMKPIEPYVDGYPIDIALASFDERERLDLAVAGEASWTSAYQKRVLPVVEEDMTIMLSASPDNGWPVLKDFLGGTRGTLTVAMYDFGAPHILREVKNALSSGQDRMTLVIQAGESLSGTTKANDVEDKVAVEEIRGVIGGRLEQAWASVAKIGLHIVNPAGLFESSYHIKVAVRDTDAFWLSSGNWQSSNQAPLAEPGVDLGTDTNLWNTYNREWHVVVKNRTLAEAFRDHIEKDLEEARDTAQDQEAVAETEQFVWVPEEYFAPSALELEAGYRRRDSLKIEGVIKVQPLLTPDNYSEEIVRLLETAESRILFQNQTFKPRSDGGEKPGFRELIDVMLRKQRQIRDVRIILRRIGEFRQNVTDIVRRGFDLEKLHAASHCHTKGIIVDNKAVVIGSHNWSSQGTTTNRDASLIIYNADAVQYYADLFEADWQRTRVPQFDEDAQPVALVRPTDPPMRSGMRRVRLNDWLSQIEG